MKESKRFFIAGVQHHDLRSVLDVLEEGDELDLVSEPDNKFDPNAVKIEYEGTMLGYVPKKFSAEVSAALELEPLMCVITSLNPSAKPWEMCEVEISSDPDFEVEDEDLEDEEDGVDMFGVPLGDKEEEE